MTLQVPGFERADRSQYERPSVDVLGDGMDLAQGDGIDPGNSLIEREVLDPRQLVATQTDHSAAGVLHRQRQPALHVAHGAVELFGGQTVLDHFLQLFTNQREHLRRLVRCCPHVHAESTRVGVRHPEGVDGVCQPAFLTNPPEQSRRHPSTDDVVENPESKTAIIASLERLATYHQVCLFSVASDYTDAGPDLGVDQIVIRCRPFPLAETLTRHGNGVLVLDVPRRSHHQRGGVIAPLPVAGDDIPSHSCYRVACTQNGFGEHVVSPQRSGELIVSDVGRVVFVHVDFFEYDRRLRLNLVFPKGRSLDHLRQQLHPHAEILITHLSPVAGVLLRSEGIAPGSYRVEGFCDLAGADVLSSLEQQVLEEVGAPRLDLHLVPTPGVHPASNRDRSDGRHCLGYDAQAVGKCCELMIHERRSLLAPPSDPSTHRPRSAEVQTYSLGDIIKQSAAPLILLVSIAVACSGGASPDADPKTTSGVATPDDSSEVSIAPATRPPDRVEVSIVTADGLALEATVFPGGPDWAVLAHMRPADKESWTEFAALLQIEGYTVLAYNNRGYGASEGDREPFDLTIDGEAALDYAVTNGARGIVLGGASMNGAAAMTLGASHDLEAIFVLSAVPSFPSVPDASGFLPNIDEPILFVAAEDDGAATSDLDSFVADAIDPSKFVLEVGGHGTNMLNASPDLGGRIVDWVVGTASSDS